MENFGSKLAIILLGTLWGAISGLLSVYGLQFYGMFIFPPLVFWGCFIFVATILLGPIWSRYIQQLVFFLLIYLAVIFTAFSFTLVLPLGGVLIFVSIFYGLKLRNGFKYLKVAVVLQLVVGIIVDIFHPHIFTTLQQLSQSWLYQGRDPANGAVRGMIFLWQTIMMAAITLQLYTERLNRRNLESQAPAEVGPTEP
jgi:hypothetical protein